MQFKVPDAIPNAVPASNAIVKSVAVPALRLMGKLGGLLRRNPAPITAHWLISKPAAPAAALFCSRILRLALLLCTTAPKPIVLAAMGIAEKIAGASALTVNMPLLSVPGVVFPDGKTNSAADRLSGKVPGDAPGVTANGTLTTNDGAKVPMKLTKRQRNCVSEPLGLEHVGVAPEVEVI